MIQFWIIVILRRFHESANTASYYHSISLTITREKTIMRGILGIILLITFFVSPLSAQELKGTLKQVKRSGQIRIGYRVSEPPMSFLDKDGNPAGYSIDICKGIVTKVENKIGMDVNVEYVPVTADGRFKALVDSKIDILCGSTIKRFPVANLLTLLN
jgi:ABC-type amino acid transport substrate-binding protein